MESPKPEIPSPFQRSVCWLALSSLALLVVVGMVGGIIYGLGQIFIALEPVLLPVIIAGILAYLLHPCVMWVQRRVRRRLAAVLIVMGSALGLLVALGFCIIPPLVEQTGELVEDREAIMEKSIATGRDILEENQTVQAGVDMLYNNALKAAREDNLPTETITEMTEAESYEQKIVTIINFHSSFLTEKALEWLTAGTRAIYGATAFIIGAAIMPVFLFYFLLKSEAITENWHTVLPLRASRFRHEVVATLQQINGYIVSFVRGQMLVSLIDGILLGIALKIMGLPYAITIAAAAALLGIIPYIGMIMTSIPALIIAGVYWGDLTHVIIVASIFLTVSQLDGWLIQPRIVGDSVGMHDLTVMFSVLFWSVVLGGVVGALLAVPLTASIKVIFMRYVWPTLGATSKETEAKESPEPAQKGNAT